MNLYTKLLARQTAGKPIRVGLIGAGKFGSMFLSQVRHIPGMHLYGIADLSADRAKAALTKLEFDIAERTLVRCQDYQGIQFVKSLRHQGQTLF